MAIPDYQSLMLPLVLYAKDEQEHSIRDAIESLAEQFQLSDEERKELLPSGQQTTFDNRVGWARTYLKKAGLIEYTRRGYFRVTPRGLSVVNSPPQRINLAFLSNFPEFLEFRTRRNVQTQDDSVLSDGGVTRSLMQDTTPEEVIEDEHQKLRENLAGDLLATVKKCSPAFFERLVIDLLLKMGYGGTRRDAGRAIGRSGDGGIDGVINEDRLGLDAVYVQAKRWDNGTVGRPEIQKFVGALQGQRARKGIFITTSTFSKDAHDYASRIDTRVTLIDGEQLAQFMIDFNVGVSVMAVYELKKIDSDYFNEV
ncbi:MAG TPA: restriction endonuclease [Blastocatellia bacterium]|nr:restriction endonuclease [Blastocatellia bacterium]